jgi:hypothetical protein
MFIPKNIQLYELLPKAQYQLWKCKYGEKRLWWWMGYEMPWTLQAIRDLYDRRMYLNNWYWGGEHQYRGFRPMNCPIGADGSLHKVIGAAQDFMLDGIASEQVRIDIKRNPDEPAFQYIKAVELDTVHVHIDRRNHDRAKYGIMWIPKPEVVI